MKLRMIGPMCAKVAHSRWSESLSGAAGPATYWGAAAPYWGPAPYCGAGGGGTGGTGGTPLVGLMPGVSVMSFHQIQCCLLYTSDAADDLLCVDLGGRHNIN